MLVTAIKKLGPFLVNLSLAAFFVFSLAFFVFHLIYSQRIIPGVYLSGVGSLSGLSGGEAYKKILSKFSQYENEEINFVFGSKSFTQTLPRLGVRLSAAASSQKAFKVGRSGALWSDLAVEVKSLLAGAKVEAVYSLDPELWPKAIAEMVQNIKGKEGYFDFNKKLYIVPETKGFRVNEGELEKEILANVAGLKNPVTINLETFEPRVTTELLKSRFSEVQNLLLERPHLVYGSKKFYLTEKEYLSFLSIKEDGSLSFDLEQIKAYISKLSSQINRPAKALSFKVEGTAIKNLVSGQEGLAVEVDLVSRQLFLDIQSGKKVETEISVKKTKPAVPSNELGIEELLAEGFSNFTGSIPGRIRNIKRAAAQMNGVLVPPGEAFSFGQAVGEISAATGYDYAYIISEGRTVLGTGGGVCQVSTTVFRAALNAGLPILKRSAHAYRVHYYEQASPVGLDATVYLPTVDLSFKNDTAAYILMTSEVEGEDLRIKFYGKSDGRTAELKGPTILSTSAAPPSLFQEDPTLPLGVRKQIDFAAGGASVVFERVVKRGDAVLYQDKFVSNYRPWRAVYLVGTKT